MHIIAGTHKSRKITAPKGLKTRPTSGQLRETLFNICQHEISDAEFLDLFAGTGAVGLEALSRGAKKSVFIEKDRSAAECIRRNLETFGLHQSAEVIQGDVWKSLARLRHPFDLIYADPPYGEKIGEVLYSTMILREIDASRILLRNGGQLFIEEGKEWNVLQEKLETLTLISSRRAGRTMLYHFQKVMP